VDIAGGTKVEVLGRRWLSELPADRSSNTRQAYSYVLENYVRSDGGRASGTGGWYASYRPHAEGEPLVDLDRNTVEINATIVRIKGEGLIIQERPKGVRR
jgi:hypothetical protein